MYYKVTHNKDGSCHLGDDHFQNFTSLLQTGILDSCACGMPEENLEYILGGLELIADRGPESFPPNDKAWDTWWDEHKAATLYHHGWLKAAYFFYYWADNMGFTEHGGAVPGWLTDKGKEVLDLLKEWKASQ